MPLRPEPPEVDDAVGAEHATRWGESGSEPTHLAELAELASSLEALIERVDELSMAILREALAEGAQQRPEAERRLARVRNALVRAVQILGR
ncbi:MAG: hypothetical protein M0004_03465 [Actinomycetota bacterium]|nr:hypothetical protein [Actinomycetota bacterium]